GAPPEGGVDAASVEVAVPTAAEAGSAGAAGTLLSGAFWVCLPALFRFPLRFLLSRLRSGFHGCLGLGQAARGLLVDLDIARQMLAEFGVEFLGRAGVSERCA